MYFLKQSNFRVVLRVRPPVQRELDADYVNATRIDQSKKTILISEAAVSLTFY